MSQLALPTVSDADLWAEIVESIRDIVRARGNKDVAFALDISGSELSNALAERNRCELKLRQLPTLLRLRQDDTLPRVLAKASGLELAAPRPLTAAERLERLEGALGRAGVVGQAILADAFNGGGRWGR